MTLYAPDVLVTIVGERDRVDSRLSVATVIDIVPSRKNQGYAV
jgi:hypothetical protein